MQARGIAGDNFEQGRVVLGTPMKQQGRPSRIPTS
jgi:hypothetical protein